MGNLERLAEAERELTQLVNPEDEPNERITTNEADSAPESAETTLEEKPTTKETAPAPDDEVIRAVRKQAINDAIAAGG